jgi:calcium/calmodulin-dependent protein kinase kinase 2
VNKKVAIKILNKMMLSNKRFIEYDESGRVKAKTMLDNLKVEIAIMKKLNHDNIIKLWEVIESPNSHKIYLV